jgi:hypothetical protein
MDVGARHGQVVVGARQVEVGRLPRAGGGNDLRRGSETLQRQDSGQAGSADQRLLEARGIARGLSVDQGRVAVDLKVPVDAAAREPSGEAVAEGDVFGEIGGLAKGGPGREKDERQEARQYLDTMHLLVSLAVG